MDANAKDLKNLCEILGIDNLKYDTVEKISHYMGGNNKTTWALKIFESDKKVQYPEYIRQAVAWCDE